MGVALALTLGLSGCGPADITPDTSKVVPPQDSGADKTATPKGAEPKGRIPPPQK